MDESAYNRSVLDAARINAYARKVAKQAAGRVTPLRYQPTREVTRERAAGFLGMRRETYAEHVPNGPAVEYWLLEAVAEEGERRVRQDHSPFSFEDGFIVGLRRDGVLVYSRYWVAAHAFVPGAPETALIGGLEPLGDGRLTFLDYESTATYRDRRPKTGEIRREELKYRARLAVATKGVGVSRALSVLFRRAGGQAGPGRR